MVLLSEGVAGVTRIVSGGGRDPEVAEVEAFLSGVRAKLAEMGYRIIDMEETAEDALNYRYYVNGIPYRNAKTGRREFLMPVFPESTSVAEKDLLRKNVSAIESLGYKVILVPTTANRHQGGIHCLVNVIL